MISKELKIEIRRIPNRDGIAKYSDKIQVHARAHVIIPSVDPATKTYVTGLSDEDIEYLSKAGMTEALDNRYRPMQAGQADIPFWESRFVKVELQAQPMFLYPGRNIYDFIKYKWLLTSPYIYANEAAMKRGGKPFATHYIYNEEEEVQIKAGKLAETKSIITSIAEQSLERKRQLLLIVNDEDTTNKSEDYVNVKLNDLLEDTNKRKEIKQLLSEEALVINIKSDLRMAVKRSLVKKKREGYFFFDMRLGHREADVVKFLMTDEGQESYLLIKEQIK